MLAGVLALTLLWSTGRNTNPGPIGFRLDDAWIHLVYGRGLLEDHALSYNPGMPTSGCTSPLWAMVLAVLHAMFGRGESLDALIAAIFVTSAILHCAAIAVAVKLAQEATRSAFAGKVTGSAFAGGVAGLLVALATPWAAAAFSGMEVTLTGLLLLLGVREAMRSEWTRAGLWLAGACLARPESAVLVMLAAIAARRPKNVLRVIGPSLVGGAIIAIHHFAFTGSPLPATFWAKSNFSLMDLPRRFGVAVAKMLSSIPPWKTGIGWLSLLGFVPLFGARLPAKALWPLAAGVAYLAANVALIDPVDPKAFYHLRYVLPAVPLMLVALAIGAHGLGGMRAGSLRFAPAALVALLAMFDASRTVADQSRHLHNDVRNINEVQRTIGLWMHDNLEPRTWIAATDAGAIRYVSLLPTIDVLGLNTPEMFGAKREAFVREHPVQAIAVMPAWFEPEKDVRGLRVAFGAETEDYTVTSNPKMALQLVLMAAANTDTTATAADSAAADPDTTAAAPQAEVPHARSTAEHGTQRVRFRGFRSFEVELSTPSGRALP
jgi:hypothetical protein